MSDAARYSAAMLGSMVRIWMFGVVMLGACGDGASQQAAAPPPPALGPLELPVSLRATDPSPAGCYDLELTPTEMRVGGQPQLQLVQGKFALAGAMSGVASKLDATWQRPPRACVGIRAHAMVPYQTLALVLASAHRAGVKQVALQVRKPGAGAELGWIVPTALMTVLPGEDAAAMTGARARSWDEFSAAWQAMSDACSRVSQTGGCGSVSPSVASGGSLKLVLRAAGQGANLEFERVGLSEAQLAAEAKQRKAKRATAQEDVVQGRVQRTDVEKDLLEGDPASQASFQFRSSELSNPPSVLRAVLQPLCGSSPCPAVVAAEPSTPLARVVALIGAAFPDGSGTPTLAFEEPTARK